MTVSVQDYPLDCNRDQREMRLMTPEQLVILQQVGQQAHGNQVGDELMFLVDFLNERTYWFSKNDRQIGPRFQPNINDKFQVDQIIHLLTTRKFLK